METKWSDLLIAISAAVPLATVKYEFGTQCVTFMIRCMDHKNGVAWATHRRYSEFHALMERLLASCTALKPLKSLMPPKVLSGTKNRSVAVIEKRRAAFAKLTTALLDALVHSPSGPQQPRWRANATDLLSFLECPAVVADELLADRDPLVKNTVQPPSPLHLLTRQLSSAALSDSGSISGRSQPDSVSSGHTPRMTEREVEAARRGDLIEHHLPTVVQQAAEESDEEAQTLEETLWEAPPDDQLQRRHLTFSLPLCEYRLSVDGRWVVVVRHAKSCQRCEIRQRYDEAVYISRALVKCETIPTVGEMQDLMMAHRRLRPLRKYMEDEMTANKNGLGAVARLDRFLSSQATTQRSSMPREDDPARLSMASLDNASFGSIAMSVGGRQSLVLGEHEHLVPAPKPSGAPRTRQPSNTRHVLFTPEAFAALVDDDTAERATPPPVQNSKGDKVDAMTDVEGAQHLRVDPSPQPGSAVKDSNSTSNSILNPLHFDPIDETANAVVEASQPLMVTKDVPKKKGSGQKVWRGCSCTEDRLCTTGGGQGEIFKTISGHVIVFHPCLPGSEGEARGGEK